MPRTTQIVRLSLAAVWLAVPALAQAPAPAAAPAPTAAPPPAPLTVPTAGNPNLAVASVKLENGVRASKIIGSAVVGDNNASLGTVEDLILNNDNTVAMAVIGVGGFAGVGAKRVAVPFTGLHRADNDRMQLPGMTREQLTAMPDFVY